MMQTRHYRLYRLSALLLPALGLGLTPTAVSCQSPAPTTAEKPVGRQQPSRIGEIVVKGNKTLKDKEIITAARIRVGMHCTPETLTDIKTRIFNMGLFGWHVANIEDAVKVSSEELPAGSGKHRVTIEVDENDTIKSVNIFGNGPVPVKEIRKV